MPEEARVLRALHRYGLSQEMWEKMPEITPIIWRVMGGQTKAVEMLRFSEDEQVQAFLKIFYAMTKDDQQKLPLEIVCFAAKVAPQHILGQLVLSARDASRAESALVLMMTQSDVLRATTSYGIAFADNFKDRELALKAAGILPSPAGSSVNVNLFGAKGQEEGPEYQGESQLESDVFNYDSSEVEGWGHDRRQVLDGE